MAVDLAGVAAVIMGASVATAAPAPTISVDGSASDALYVRGEIWLTTADKSGRKLVRVDAKAKPLGGTLVAAQDAVFVDACPDGRVVFADPNGVVDTDGHRVVEARGLFTVPDPDALLVADLCGKSADGKDELRFPVVDGVAVKRGGRAGGGGGSDVVDGGGGGGDGVRVLRMKHEARAYSGRVHRGLRPDRGYAEALSLYGPAFLDVDVDGDGDSDLVAVREGTVVVWRRGEGGELAVDGLTVDLGRKIGAGADADLRIRIADLDGDKRADAVIGVTRGAVPERSEAWVVSSTPADRGDKGGPFSSSRALWRRDGLVAAIGNRGRALVVAEVDTSLVSLSAVVLTGRIPVKVGLDDGGGGARGGGGVRGVAPSPLLMQAKVDVRKGSMDGALPVVSVDFDKDGTPDLLDLGEPGTASLHLATRGGFALDAAVVWDVPAFVHVVAMPELPGVVLVGTPARGKTAVAIVTR